MHILELNTEHVCLCVRGGVLDMMYVLGGSARHDISVGRDAGHDVFLCEGELLDMMCAWGVLG